MAVAAKAAVNAELDNVTFMGGRFSDIKKKLKKPENQIAGTAAQSPIDMGKTGVATRFESLNGEESMKKSDMKKFFMIHQRQCRYVRQYRWLAVRQREDKT